MTNEVLVAFAAAAAPTVAVIASWLLARKARQENQVAVQEIHVLVNEKMTLALERIEILEKALHLAPGEEP